MIIVMLNTKSFSVVDISAFKMTYCPFPFFLTGIAAGFPSPADDYIEKQLDLNDLVVKHPHATFSYGLK